MVSGLVAYLMQHFLYGEDYIQQGNPTPGSDPRPNYFWTASRAKKMVQYLATSNLPAGSLPVVFNGEYWMGNDPCAGTGGRGHSKRDGDSGNEGQSCREWTTLGVQERRY